MFETGLCSDLLEGLIRVLRRQALWCNVCYLRRKLLLNILGEVSLTLEVHEAR